jgi:hypothetical protein
MAVYVIEPANSSGVVHSLTISRDYLGRPGRWTGYCGTIVAGLILDADIVDGKPCRKCAAHRVKFAKWCS